MSLLCALACALAQDPAADLAAAVDLAEPRARRVAALTLALRKDVTFEQWLATARVFAPGAGAPRSPGAHSVQVELPVLDAVEMTTLHLYVPAGFDAAKPAPLLMAFHGAGGEGLTMLAEWRATADALGMLICAPTDPQAQGGYAFTPRERAAALAALRWARRRYDVDENRVHLAGSSRGGHLAWDLALRAPDLWASVSPRIGGPTIVVSGGRNNLRYVENLAAVPIRDLQGAEDDAKLLVNLRLAFDRLRAAGARDAQMLEQPGFGHAYDHGAVDWAEWLGGCVREPFPATLRIRCAEKDPARIGWVRAAKYGKEVAETFQIRVGAEWDSWDHARQVRYIVELADARTAELRVERAADGILRVSGAQVQRALLTLPAEYLAAQPKIVVQSGGKEKRVQPRASARVLLEDFVERFDRTFLPAAEVEVTL